MKFKQTHFTQEKTNYCLPSWDQMNQLAFEISKQIQDQEIEFDRIVTLAKGGWPLTRSLVDFLQIDKVASIGVSFYTGVDVRLEQPRIYQDIPISVQGENILLFDDVADTGKSLEFTVDYLKTRGVKTVKTATLFYKPHSQIEPDFYGAETRSWIIFPYDIVEMIDLLGHKWLKLGLSIGEVEARFKQLDFNPTWTKHYIQQLLTN